MGLLLLTLTIQVLLYIPDYSLKYNSMELYSKISNLWNLIDFLILQKIPFYQNPNNFILHYIILFHQICVDVFNIINCKRNIIHTKIIDVSIKPCFFNRLSVDQLLEIFPKHNWLATISEYFALNLINSVPLTNK